MFNAVSLPLQRALDIAITSILITMLTPILIFCAFAIFRGSGHPIFFKQTRVGFGKRRFFIYKFRTMTNEHGRNVGDVVNVSDLNAENLDAYQRTQSNDPRITAEGIWLRKFHLYELPQLFNVLMGEMSLVGPRPDAPIQELTYREVDWEKRAAVRPGITGLAQISSDAYHSGEARTKLDLAWVDRRSLYLYIQLLIQTFIVVIFKKTPSV